MYDLARSVWIVLFFPSTNNIEDPLTQYNMFLPVGVQRSTRLVSCTFIVCVPEVKGDRSLEIEMSAIIEGHTNAFGEKTLVLK